MSLVICHYDLETTGFVNKSSPLSDPSQPRIVQIGAILDDENGVEISRLDVIIAQREPVPEKAYNVHKIDMEKSQRVGVSETTAIELLLDFIDVADVIVGHNVKGYDNQVVIGSARRVIQNEAFDPFAGKTIFDTMLAGTGLCKLPGGRGGFKPPKLIELHQHLLGEGFEDAHQAISDILATRRCYWAMQDLMDPARKASATA